MKCPHCSFEFHDSRGIVDLGEDIDGEWRIIRRKCVNCKRLIFHLNQFKYERDKTGLREKVICEMLIRPKMQWRPPAPIEVPTKFSDDYNEACLVLKDSPKASAALSRRCLQNIIREKLNIKRKDLYNEIQDVIENGLLPIDLLESIDAVRNIGNFAAHPIKSQSTGEIVNVEPHEAEWNLNVLEMFFEFLFVRPALILKNKEALNIKLRDAGKKPMK